MFTVIVHTARRDSRQKQEMSIKPSVPNEITGANVAAPGQLRVQTPWGRTRRSVLVLSRKTHDELHQEIIQMLQRWRHCLVRCLRRHWIISPAFDHALRLAVSIIAPAAPIELPS